MDSRTRPLVTICITTYNRADGYLGEALRSALSQTYPSLEILVGDNGSTDGTEALVRTFSDPRLRYFRHAENIGANNNYNFCLRQARGAYFLLLHDDDVVDPDFVEACMDAARDDTTLGIIRTGTRLIDAAGRGLRSIPNRVGGLSTADFMLGWFAGRTTLYLCSTLFNTARLLEIGGFQSKTLQFQDVIAQMTLAARWGRADVPDVKAAFRVHGGNMGTSFGVREWTEDSLFLLDRMCALVPEDRRDAVRTIGMRYFARTNYGHATRIPSLVERFRAYAEVHRRFEYAYSPVRYLAVRYLRGAQGRLRQIGNAASDPTAAA